MKLIGLYECQDIPSLERNHRSFCRHNDISYERYPIHNYFEKYRLIYHLLEKYPEEVLLFIDSDSYFTSFDFNFTLKNGFLIQSKDGVVLDNFLVIQSSLDTRRILKDFILPAASSEFLLKNLRAFHPPFPEECMVSHPHQENGVLLNLDLCIAAPNPGLLVSRVKPNAWQSFSYANLLCDYTPREYPVNTSAFEVINPGNRNALVTLYTGEIADIGAISETSIGDYCRANNITYYVYRRIPDELSHLSGTWCKPYLLLSHMENHEHIGWIDSDIIIVGDWNVDFSGEIRVYNDIGLWYFNAGFMVFRNCEKNKQLLHAVIAKSDKLGPRHSTYIHGGDQPIFNNECKAQYPGELPLSNLVTNAFPEFTENSSRHGLIHFMGMTHTLRLRLMDVYYQRNLVSSSKSFAKSGPGEKHFKILILQISTPAIRDFAQYSIPINSEYALTHGIDYHLFQRDHFEYHPSWLKLEALKEINTQGYDYIWVLDSDAVINNPTIDLQAIIKNDPKRFIASKNGRNEGRLMNCGSFLIVPEIIPNLLDRYEKWILQSNPYLYKHTWEQELINDWYDEDPNLFSVREMDELNSHWRTMPHDNFIHHFMARPTAEKAPLIAEYTRRKWAREDVTTLGEASAMISKLFPLFRPNSAVIPGIDNLTIQAINQAMPFLGLIAEHLHGKKLEFINIRDFASTENARKGVSAIKELFDRNGSDKANYHNYHELYGCILHDRANVRSVLEIGLGTNNTDIACNMGSGGKPGASLRAFRDYFPKASIYGADIDHSILFEEERIRTFHVDQTDPETFEKLAGSLPGEIDLIIDDGLHAPNANLLTFLFGVKKVSAGGWVVIEDVTSPVIWQTVAALLPENLKPYFLHAENGMIFAVQRLY